MFHKIRFPLRKAFYIVFLVVSGKKGISTHDLGRKLELRQKTCWLFKRKVMEAHEEQWPAYFGRPCRSGRVFCGRAGKGQKGKGNDKKRLVAIAIQVDNKGIYRSYAKVIPSADHIELGAFFDTYIDTSAGIRTDGWTGYLPPERNLYEDDGRAIWGEREIVPVDAQAHHDAEGMAEGGNTTNAGTYRLISTNLTTGSTG